MWLVLSGVQGRYVLAPGDMSYSEEKLLQFFGQLVGVAIRADVPIALDLLPCFWKSLKGETLLLDDLREADCITYHLTQKLLAVSPQFSCAHHSILWSHTQCSSVEEFDELLAGLTHNHGRGDERDGGTSTYPQGLTFVYHTMTGQEAELCSGGRLKQLT